MTRQEAGRLGGTETLRRHGRAHMRAIGRRGFQALADRHYGGDRQAAGEALARAGLRALDPFPWNGFWQR